jgi:hypothetical protein
VRTVLWRKPSRWGQQCHYHHVHQNCQVLHQNLSQQEMPPCLPPGFYSPRIHVHLFSIFCNRHAKPLRQSMKQQAVKLFPECQAMEISHRLPWPHFTDSLNDHQLCRVFHQQWLRQRCIRRPKRNRTRVQSRQHLTHLEVLPALTAQLWQQLVTLG